MPEQKTDWSLFAHPRVLYTELNLTAAAGALPRATTNFNDLKCSRDLLIDYIYIGDDGTLATGDVTVGQSNLQGLNLNWQIADRAPFLPQALLPALAMDNWWDCDRSQTYPMQNPGVVYRDLQGSLYWRHTIRWVFNPNQSFRLDWEKRSNGAPGGIPTVNLRVAMYGVGLRTGHRRIFSDVGTVLVGPVGAVGAAVQTGQIVNPSLMSNVADEPYLIEGISFPLDGTWAPANTDPRAFNFLRVKITPTQGEPWSDVPIPLAVYGINKAQYGRGAIFKPPGGPILLKAGQAVTFECQNTLARATQVQIALVGRTAPGYGSLY